ncbi:MAG TPA: aromatic ring-hydroxylating dioxygenase subunit alpha [Mycobacteriales bacterium]|nr:aromatic ring-hydroxylating dioxygenase subunit alpha [Mycobacteriales bacterium]
MTRAPIEPSLLEPVTRPLASARTLPAVAYASEEVHAWERAHFFDAAWVCAGRADEVGAPGDQRAVTVGGTSLLLVRDHDGTLRGWYNVCRHRGHELLAPGTARRGRAIRCPYHDWVYGLGGECRATPRFGKDSDDGIDRAAFGLVPARVQEWQGWVFANVSGDAPPLAAQLGNFGMVVDGYDVARLRLGARHAYEVAANWKVVVENYLECYHCAPIHPELCEVTPPESGTGYPAAPTGTWTGGPLALRAGVQTMSLDGRSLGVPIPGLPAERSREVGYAALLPSLLVSPHPDYLMTHRLTPLAAGRTTVECSWYFPPEAWDRAGFDPAYAADFWDVVNRQDWAACESVQRNMTSPGWRPGPFSPWESDVHAVMAAVARGYATGRLSADQRDQAATGQR